MTRSGMMLAAEFKTSESLTRLDVWDAPTNAGVAIEATVFELGMDLRAARWLVLTVSNSGNDYPWDAMWVDLDLVVESTTVGVDLRTGVGGYTELRVQNRATGQIWMDDLSGGSISLLRAEAWATGELGYVVPFGSGGSATARVTYSTAAPTSPGNEGDVHAVTHDGTASGTVFAHFAYDADQNEWVELSAPEVVTVTASRALLPTDYGKTLLVPAGVTLSVPPLATISPAGAPYFLARVRFTGATNAVPATIALAAGNTATTSFLAPYGATLTLTGEERVIEMSGSTAWVS